MNSATVCLFPVHSSRL